MTREDGPRRPTESASSNQSATTIGPSIGRMIAATADACGRRPLLTLAVSLALAAVALVYAVHTITFVSAHLRLLPQNERYVVRLKEYQQDFGELNDIVVVVES